MSKQLFSLVMASAALLTILSFLSPAPAPTAPAPERPAPAAPRDQDAARRPRPWRPLRPQFEAPLIETPAPDGTLPQIDFEESWWFRNIGSKKDGAGMCVFTSFEFLTEQMRHPEFKGFRDWCAERYPGGGYPAKLAQLVDAFCKAKGIKTPVLRQYEGSDPAFLDRCLGNGWMPCVTLFHSPRYGGKTIYHMVCCSHLDGKWLAIQDNNFQPTEWWERAKGLQAIQDKGQYWAVCIPEWTAPPPAPK